MGRIAEILIYALIFSIDAFAVSICKGLAMKRVTLSKALTVGAWFGTFQAIMPLIGYFFLAALSTVSWLNVDLYDHWIAFALLLIIGSKMIYEALSQKECDENGCEIGGSNESLAFKVMLIMAIATSVDAMAGGVGLAIGEKPLSPVMMLIASVIIGITTFIISMLGVKFGNIFGTKYEKPASIIGGCILILLGVYKVIEGVGVIAL